MRVFVVRVMVLAMLLFPLAGTANPFNSVDLISVNMLAQRGPLSILPKQAGARISSKQATSRVKQKYRDSKILSINLIKSKGPSVYRVKTLTASAVVKYVYVDGTTGDVFE